MSKHYIDNKRFEFVIREYQKNPDDTILERELVELLDILIINIFQSFGFTKLEFDDVKQECLLLAIIKLSNFNSDKGSAFNYFTTVIVNNMRFLYTKEKKYNEKSSQYLVDVGNNILDRLK